MTAFIEHSNLIIRRFWENSNDASQLFTSKEKVASWVPDWASLPYTSISSTSSDETKKSEVEQSAEPHTESFPVNAPVQLVEDSTRFFLLGGSSWKVEAVWLRGQIEEFTISKSYG